VQQNSINKNIFSLFQKIKRNTPEKLIKRYAGLKEIKLKIRRSILSGFKTAFASKQYSQIFL